MSDPEPLRRQRLRAAAAGRQKSREHTKCHLLLSPVVESEGTICSGESRTQAVEVGRHVECSRQREFESDRYLIEIPSKKEVQQDVEQLEEPYVQQREIALQEVVEPLAVHLRLYKARDA